MALGKTDFGLYGVVGGLTVFIAFFNGLLSQATGRFYAVSIGEAAKDIDNETNRIVGLENCQQWFSTAVLLHTLVPLFLIATGYPLGIYVVKHCLIIPPDRLYACIWVFRFVCIACFVSMINVPFQAMYTAKQYIAELTIYSFLQTTANLFFVYYMVTHPGDWLARYAFWMCLVMVVPQIFICIRAILVFPECKLRFSFMWNLHRISSLARFAFWQGFGTLGVALRGQGIQLLINGYYHPSVNASFTIANQVSAQSQTLSASLQGAFAPAITTAYGAQNYAKMLMLSYQTCKFGLLLGLIFVLPLAIELREVLTLWLINPPEYSAELCWSVLIMMLIDRSASGHMLAVSAKGKIAAYQAFLGSCLILTLPIAWLFVANGFGVESIGVAMVCTMALCVCGRVWFARSLVGMSAKYWFRKIILPVGVVNIISGLAGYLPHFFMVPSFARVCVTTILCEMVFCPLVWCVLLDCTEREFLIKFASGLLKNEN